MGSRTPEEHQQMRDGPKPISQALANVAKPRGAFPEDDLGGSNEDDADGDENAESAGLSAAVVEANKKKKRKKPRKKKPMKECNTVVEDLKQSSPPRVLLSSLFPSEIYPPGQLLNYDENLVRVAGEELRSNDRMDTAFLNNYRQAAEVHRKVRQHVQATVKPGKSLSAIAQEIENGVRALTGHQGLVPGDSLLAGMGFPTGLCLNNIAAHYTPNSGQKDIILKRDDVLKVDFGVHVNGRIVDSAFTMAWDPTFDNLLASVKDATNTGVMAAGIDARMSEIGAAIQEVMESYELEIKGKTYPIKAIRNIAGHDIKPYRIHGDKQVPFVKNSSLERMEEGEIFAIETFGTTGRGYLKDDVGIYGYGRNSDINFSQLHHPAAKSLLKIIDENFGTIVFCRRYLERLGIKNYLPAMKTLLSSGILHSYCPLSDIQGSYTAQFEHTILLRSSVKEVISRGDDY
ncbi:methionine aminopeptidase 2-like protein [Bisporella sp. PMI_857]|nr:methionine aminopeptidase 2-like protein [Bisporella sp. PMI_857]